MAVFLLIFSKNVVGPYNQTPEVIALGSQVMLIVAVLLPVQGIRNVISGGLRGAGDTKYAASVVFFTTTILRPITLFRWFISSDCGVRGCLE